jgi:hypothetical protein
MLVKLTTERGKDRMWLLGFDELLLTECNVCSLREECYRRESRVPFRLGYVAKNKKKFVVIRVGSPSHFSDIFSTFVCKKKIFWSAYSKLEVSIGKQLQTSANV